jgi:hypothetical protein
MFPQGTIADILDYDDTVSYTLKESEEPSQIPMFNLLKSLKLPPEFSCQILTIQLRQQKRRANLVTLHYCNSPAL